MSYSFEEADDAAKAINSLNGTHLGNRRIHVHVSYNQRSYNPHDAHSGFAESPFDPLRSYSPRESITRTQPMDGSMDIFPDAIAAVSKCTAQGMHSNATRRYQITEQQHIAAPQKSPKKKGHYHSVSMENTRLSASSGQRIQRSHTSASTNGKPSYNRSSQSSNSDQQFMFISNGLQGVRTSKDDVADGSPSKKKKLTDTVDGLSEDPPGHVSKTCDDKILCSMVENSQQETQASTDQGGIIGARHGSFDRPESTVYSGSDSTSEATGYRASPKKGHGGSPGSKDSQSVHTRKPTAIATTQGKLKLETFSLGPSDDQPPAAHILKSSVVHPKGNGKRQQDRYTVTKYPKVGVSTFTGTSTTAELLPLSQKENSHVGRALDQRNVFTNEATNEILDLIQHQNSSGDDEVPTDSTAGTTDGSQTEHLHSARPRDITPAKVSHQSDFRYSSPKAETRAVEIGCSCPPQSVPTESPATAQNRKSQVVGEKRDSNTLKLCSDESASIPDTPKSKKKAAAGSQKKSTKKPSAVMPPSHTLGSGAILAPMQRSTAVVSPPKADDEFAFPPLGSSGKSESQHILSSGDFLR